MEGDKAGPRQAEFEVEPIFLLLCNYFDGDRRRAIAEVTLLIEDGKNLKDACEIIIASYGFEKSFY